jgi:predicted methyltransferase
MTLSRTLPGSALLALLLAIVTASPAHAQKESVRPGINANFETPDVAQWTERFERNGRDVYDKRQEIAAACAIREGQVVADIGAGSGLFTRLFSPLVGAQGRIYAVDISDEFVAAIEKKCREAGLTNIRAILCSADDAKLPAGEVDLAFICDTYHHFEFPHKTMASIHRALKPGGRVVLIDFKRIEGESPEWILKHVRAGQEVFTREIEQAGFKQVAATSLSPETYMLTFEKPVAAPAAPTPSGERSGE